MSNYNLGEDIEKFVELRDYLSDERRRFKELEENIKRDMSEVEARILEFQRKIGVTSISTDTHTAYQTEKTFVRLGDWDAFSTWLLETGNVQCLEKRPAKLACLELEEHGVKLHDIGLQKDTEICVQIRKK